MNEIILKLYPIENCNNTWETLFLVRLFFNEIKEKINIIDYRFIKSDQGPYYIINTDNTNVKSVLLDIKNYHPLGIYIDLYLNNKICIENKIVNTDNLNHQRYLKINNYIKNAIFNILNKSIDYQLDLENKFGLVTKTSNGSHKDMDYDLIKKSSMKIVDDLTSMFDIGFTSSDLETGIKVTKFSRKLSEAKMFEESKGVNTLKGLIFVLGNICDILGYNMKNFLNTDMLYENIKKAAIYLEEDDNGNLFDNFAFKIYHLKGLKNHLEDGLSSVKEAVKILDKYEELNNESLHMALISIISYTDDTIAYKKCKNINKYNEIKNKISNIKNYNTEEIKELTIECINNNISFGIAGDLLICSIVIYLFNKRFRFLWE